MKDFIKNFNESLWEKSLGTIVKEGAEKLLKFAVSTEFENFFSEYSQLKGESGKQLIVRNGYHKPRTIMTSAGSIKLRVPRVEDLRFKGKGHKGKVKFHSRLVPPYLRRSQEVDEFIPYLYLKGISAGDFSDVLSKLFKEEVSLCPQTVSRLKQNWEKEFEEWNQRDMSGKRYIYWWVDGVHFSIRMESSRNCILLIIGVLPDGQKELVAVEEGPVESEMAWRNILLGLKQRGLSQCPLLATGDGAAGFWKALLKEFPQTKHQRCWVHKTENVLDKLPQSVRPEGKRLIHEIYLAPRKKEALEAFDQFVQLFEAKYPRATECLLKDKEETLTFFNFPAEHWRHIRSTNAIESTFATIRLRTYKTRGCLSRKTALAMVFKLSQAAEKRWQRIHRYKLLPEVLEGKTFVDGVRHEKAA